MSAVSAALHVIRARLERWERRLRAAGCGLCDGDLGRTTGGEVQRYLISPVVSGDLL